MQASARDGTPRSPRLASWVRSRLNRLIRILANDFGEGAAIVLVDGERGTHSFGGHRLAGKRALARRMATTMTHDARSPLGQVMLTAQPVVLDDLDHRDGWAGIRSLASVPVRMPLRGMVAVWSSERARFSSEDVALVGEFGHVVERVLGPDLDPLSDAEDLLASVRHDLGNPIHAVLINLELLLAQPPADDRRRGRRHLEHALLAARQAVQLLGELDAFVAAQATRSAGVSSAGTAVTQVIDVLSAIAQQRDIELSASLFDHAALARIAPRDLFRVLSNLVSNAIKYCAPGDHVTIHTFRRDSSVTFSVIDDGPGLAPSDVRRVFDAAWLARSTIRRGSGLGLAICKRITAQYGGSISAFSVHGRGTTFTVELPLAAE